MTTFEKDRKMRLYDFTVDNCPFCGEMFVPPMVAKYYNEEDCEFFCQHDEEDSVDARL